MLRAGIGEPKRVSGPGSSQAPRLDKTRAALLLGLGCVLMAGNLAAAQESVRLGVPTEAADTLPRLLPARGLAPIQADDVKPSIVASPGDDGAPPSSKVIELPLQISTKGGGSSYMEHVVVPEFEIVLTVGVPRLVILKQNVERGQIGGGDDRSSPASFEIINKRELSLLGRRVGRTVLNLWFADPYVSGRMHIVSYHVRIEPDVVSYRQMEKVVRDRFPNSRVELQLVGNNLLVTGQARSAAEAAQILQVFRPAAGRTQGDSSLNVVNLLKLQQEPQIMLKLVVTEVNRAGIKGLGLNVPADKSLPTLLSSAQLSDAIGNLTKAKLARSLYETTLVASSGQAAKLQDGGSFAAPPAAANSNASVQYVPFGVSMIFIPTVSDQDAIHLNMEGEVTTRDSGSRARVRGTYVPDLMKRTFQSTVEVREGQTLALAGVSHNAIMPREKSFMGRLPLVGGLFGGDNVSDDQELIIMITPQLMRSANDSGSQPILHRLPPQR